MTDPGLREAGGRARSRVVAPLLVLVLMAGSVALGGCAGQEQSGTPAQRMRTWVLGAGGAGIGNVNVALRNVDLALSKHNSPAAIREVCALLSNDAQTAIGDLPAPDDQVTNQLNKAYMVATTAAGDCYGGAAGDARLLARSATERVRAASLLIDAGHTIESITGETLTTETTPPHAGGDPFGGST